MSLRKKVRLRDLPLAQVLDRSAARAAALTLAALLFYSLYAMHRCWICKFGTRKALVAGSLLAAQPHQVEGGVLEVYSSDLTLVRNWAD
jgi:hypothetical protein